MARRAAARAVAMRAPYLLLAVLLLPPLALASDLRLHLRQRAE
jgi:hypothetical protein